MQVCVQCKKEMLCSENGVAVRFNENGEHAYVGDRFECLTCGSEVIVTNANAMYDPDARLSRPNDIWMNVDRGYVPTKVSIEQAREYLEKNDICICDGSVHTKRTWCVTD